jgi:iron complex outermembrane receptor protein
MATIAYDVDQNVHVYAKYASGYRAGGASSRSQRYLAFNPETVNSYEIGLKSDLLNHHVRFNIAGYIMDRKNSRLTSTASIRFPSAARTSTRWKPSTRPASPRSAALRPT